LLRVLATVSYGCVTKKRGGEKKERAGKQEGNQEAYAGNRADPATQADTEHSRGGRSRSGTQTKIEEERNNYT
jgi:hypothetical protein